MIVFLQVATALILSYLIGSIPSGWIIVKIATGKDVTQVESGRTGGTNAMRAAGWLAGLLTGLADILKGVSTGLIVTWLLPDSTWLRVFSALAAVWGHNNSIFLYIRTPSGKIKLRGGAGGATVLGGAIALWPQIWIFIAPLSGLVFLLSGYASITTMSVAFFATIIFAVRYYMGLGPWEFIIYGVLAEVTVLWALRPNLQRLKDGTERIVGPRASWIKKSIQKTSSKQHIF
jgi:acyl phosphate:glycerol-3-phosphate acyltransferase